MSIFSWRKKSGFVGVDLGTYAIKVAEALPGNPPQIKALGQIRLPRGSILGGIYKDLEAITDKLKQLVENLGLKNRPAVVSISSYAAIIKRLNLNVPAEKDLESAIYEEAEAHVPFDLDDVYLDYQIFSEEGEVLDLLLVAAKRELVDNVSNILEEAHLLPTIIDVDVIALSNLFEYLYQPQETSLIIDLGASKTSVVLWHNQSLMANRDIGHGTLEINDILQEKLNLSFEESEKLKISGDGTEVQTAKKAIKEYFEDVIKDVQGTIDYFKSIYADCQIKKIYLCGGGANVPEVNKAFEKGLKIKTEKLAPFAKIEAKKIHEGSIDYFNHIACVAIGLGIRELIS